MDVLTGEESVCKKSKELCGSLPRRFGMGRARARLAARLAEETTNKYMSPGLYSPKS